MKTTTEVLGWAKRYAFNWCLSDYDVAAKIARAMRIAEAYDKHAPGFERAGGLAAPKHPIFDILAAAAAEGGDDEP